MPVRTKKKRVTRAIPLSCLQANQAKRNVYPAPTRTICVGDLHGDMGALRAVMEDAAGVARYDEKRKRVTWIGGEDTFVVVCGDIIDNYRPGLTTLDADGKRRDGEYAEEEYDMLEYLNDLDVQARKHGSRVLKLMGNHELGSLWEGDARYTTPFAKRVYGSAKKRAAKLRDAFARCPGDLHLIVQVGNWVFVHGGIMKQVVESIPLNGNFYQVMATAHMSKRGRDILWDRHASDEDSEATCTELLEGLDLLRPHLMQLGYHDVQEVHMAVAHTNQYLQHRGYILPDVLELTDTCVVLGGRPTYVDYSSMPEAKRLELGINFKCGTRVACTDTGMSRAFDNAAELRRLSPMQRRIRLWARRPQCLVIAQDGTLQIRVARRGLPRAFLARLGEEDYIHTRADLARLGYRT